MLSRRTLLKTLAALPAAALAAALPGRPAAAALHPELADELVITFHHCDDFTWIVNQRYYAGRMMSGHTIEVPVRGSG